MSTAVCLGSFNPITLGHLDIINRGAKLFSSVIVGICKDIKKDTIIPEQLRLEMTQASLAYLDNVTVLLFDGLACDFALKNKADVFLRGIRDAGDFAYEDDLANMNFSLCQIETLFLNASSQYKHHRSSWIREIAKERPQHLSHFIPKEALSLYLPYLATSSPSS